LTDLRAFQDDAIGDDIQGKEEDEDGKKEKS
jgi:hypothetical protein